MGDTSFTGICSSLTSLGSLFASLLFGMAFSKFHRKLSLFYIAVPAVLYFWAWLAPSQIVAIVFAAAYGFVYGGFLSESFAYAACSVPASRNGFAMGLITFCYSVGITIGVYLCTALMGTTGGFITGTYPYAAGVLLVAFVVEAIGCAKDKKEKFLEEETADPAAPASVSQ